MRVTLGGLTDSPHDRELLAFDDGFNIPVDAVEEVVAMLRCLERDQAAARGTELQEFTATHGKLLGMILSI